MALAEPTGEHNDVVVTGNPDGRGEFIILCDHASKFIPRSYGGLGMAAADLASHIAWDPGALAVSRALAEHLDAPLLWPDASRLIIDCNRALDASDLIVEAGEGRAIPGNQGLSEVQRRTRIESVHEPYHAAIEAFLASRIATGLGCALVAIHSYTPVFHGARRPWQAGVIFDRAPVLAEHIIDGLRADAGLNVGINEPYSPDDGVFYTLSRHGEQRGLPVVMIEIRNDVIADPASQFQWAARLAGILRRAPKLGRSDA